MEKGSTHEDPSMKTIVDIVSLFEADECHFLSSRARLEAFLEKVRSLHSNNSVICPDRDDRDATIFEILRNIINCLCDLISISVEEILCMPDMSSVKESTILPELLKYLFAFFVVPYLEVPVIVSMTHEVPISYSLSVREKSAVLLQIVQTLCSFSEKNSMFRSTMIQSCFVHLLTALLQLCFSPTSARTLDKSARKNCLNYLNFLTSSWVSKDQLIKSTIFIQDTSTKNKPQWLLQKCGSILTNTLLSENGVKMIILSVVSGFNESPDKVGESWERVVALSSILSALPSHGATAESYCRRACPQLVDLLVTSRKSSTLHSKDLIRVCVTTLHALHEKYPSESQLFEQVICTPLMQYAQDANIETKCDTWGDLTECIETLHQLCVSVGVVPSSMVLLLVRPYVKILLLLLVKIPASSFIPSLIIDLFHTLLKNSDKSESSSIVMSMFCRCSNAKTPNTSLNFVIDGDEDLKVEFIPPSDPSMFLQYLDGKVKSLYDILMKVDDIIGDVFLLLIKSLCDSSKNDPCQISSNKILTSSERAIEALELNEERFITFGLLTLLLETCDPNTLLCDVGHVLEFINTTITELPNKLLDNTTESVEVLRMCLSVLGVCMLSNLDSTDRQSLLNILPGLKHLALDTAVDAETKELISDLVIAISTYGAVNNVSIPDFSETMATYLKNLCSLQEDDQTVTEKDAENVENGSTSIKNVDADKLDLPQDNVTRRDRIDLKDTASIDKSISDALDDIHSTSPALRGGAVRYLTECIVKQVPSALSKVEVLTDLMMECLEDNDSFVYLSAVQGLTVLSTSCGKCLQKNAIFERIVKRFLDNEKPYTANGVFSKMKLGEIVTRIIKDMGDMASCHASLLLPALLKLSRHSDSTMRASVLSNFAELAPMVPDMLCSLQFEIKDCLCGISMSDPDTMARRAGVYAIRCIVTQLSDKVLQVFPDTIKDLYGVLKKIYRYDGDSTTQLHAQLALEELDRIMKSEIFKPLELSKKIIILP